MRNLGNFFLHNKTEEGAGEWLRILGKNYFNLDLDI